MGSTIPIPDPLPLPEITKEEIVQVDESPFYILHKDTFKKISIIHIRLKSDRDQYRNMLEALQ